MAENNEGSICLGGQRGFTLIELLVVIAVITLLMSIMMPALNQAKQQAQLVICQSNLHEWGIIVGMYTQDNGHSLDEGWIEDDICYAGGHCWPDTYWPYYENKELRFCPTVTKVGYQRAFSAWTRIDLAVPGLAPTPEGSYGKNEWCSNPPIDSGPGSRHNYKANSWRTLSVKGGGNIPLISDCWWAGGFPLYSDTPPEWANDIWLGDDELRRWCINRHNGYINSVFMDSSVRRIGLKQLWKLKWGKAFETALGPTEWPEWMAGFKEYDY